MPAPRDSLARTTLGALAFTAGLLGVVVALLVSSARLRGPSGWSAHLLREWIEHQPVGATFRLIAAFAIVMGLYLLISTWAIWLGEVATATHRPDVARLARSVASARVRRVLAAVVGLTLSTASVTATASARSPSSVPVIATDTKSVATMRFVDGSPPEDVRPSEHPTGDGPATGAAGHPVAAAVWTIEPGDHLWGLARAALIEHGAVADDAHVATYVDAIVERNLDRLAVPTDPDLIFPGQVFERPPIP